MYHKLPGYQITPIDQSQYGRRMAEYARDLGGETITLLDDRGNAVRHVAKSELVESAVRRIRATETPAEARASDDDFFQVPALVKSVLWGGVLIAAFYAVVFVESTHAAALTHFFAAMGIKF